MKCLVKGCKNNSEAGTFIGELCTPCHQMITTGDVHPKNITFIGDLARAAAMVQKRNHFASGSDGEAD